MQKQRKLVLSTFAALAVSSCFAAQAALPNGATLGFIAGVQSYDSNGNPVNVTSGSYFAVDLNNNGAFTGTEKTAIAMHDGVIIGASQPASGSHAGFVDGSESPGIDAPWNFFGNTGMFQTLNPVLDNGDGTLDFSGLGVTWNGIQNIPVGDAHATPPDSLRATIVCSSTPCQVGDTYTLDYRGHVPAGDPSGFGGVLFGLHLEGTIVNGTLLPHISISVDGGTQQECAAHGGTQVTANANVAVSPSDTVASVNWKLDGTAIGAGTQIVQLIPLGLHTLSAELLTQAGQSASSTRNITIEDTQPPTVNAAFVKLRSGQVVTVVNRNAEIGIRANAVDVCDPNPVVQAMVGAPVQDGETVKVQVEQGRVKLNVPSLSLAVTATDGAGHAASANANLTIGQ